MTPVRGTGAARLWRRTPADLRPPTGMVAVRPIIRPTATRWDRVVADLWHALGRDDRWRQVAFDWTTLREDSQACEVLLDIESRFAFAERTVRSIPTGIRWEDARPDVDTLRWEAAQHALLHDSLEKERAALRWSEPGTPARVLADQLTEREARHLKVLRAVQLEADGLVRTAGNALAASKVALAAQGGDVRALQLALPSVEAIAAAGRLGGTRVRLEALTAAWTTLDPSGTLALGAASRRDDDSSPAR